MSQTHAHPQAVSLNNLVLSQLNVRKTLPSAAEQEELKASLAAHGLLENLVVRATDDGRFEVLAGGRRLAALQALAAEGRIPADYPVRCLIHDGYSGEVWRGGTPPPNSAPARSHKAWRRRSLCLGRGISMTTGSLRCRSLPNILSVNVVV